ncbi:MAG: permease [Candidatus Dormibacteraeota bacterium]|nr:permease [Candidatus Dormibacteraeota bacterium]
MALTVLQAIGSGLREGFFMFWETLWALVLGFVLSGSVQAFVSRGEMTRVLGRPGWRSVARATALGAVSSSCSYAATAMAKSLFAKGADFIAAMAFMFASTNLVIELGVVLAVLIGWQFTASEFVGGLFMIALFALVGRVVFGERIVAAARRRLVGSGAADPDDAAARAPLSARLRSAAGWSDAASYTIADITMLRRELLIGFGVAGFLAVLVPDAWWQALFLTGHGFWSSLENVIVGPFIAIISFVCSIGNVPLAAALWKSGISFGGVVSFIFADLITLPLLLIYRRYYGWAMTLRLLGVFWFVMSAAGLAVELLFTALHAIPQTRPSQIAPDAFGLNVTTLLDIIAIAVLAGFWWLARNRARFGGGRLYAIDPVCGMQVERATAPASTGSGGGRVYFCSDHCRDRFENRSYEDAGKEPAMAHHSIHDHSMHDHSIHDQSMHGGHRS